MCLAHDIKYVNCALQDYSESPLVVAAWKNIRAALADVQKPAHNIVSAPCYECEHYEVDSEVCKKCSRRYCDLFARRT